jgi:hypothetical protein
VTILPPTAESALWRVGHSILADRMSVPGTIESRTPRSRIEPIASIEGAATPTPLTVVRAPGTFLGPTAQTTLRTLIMYTWRLAQLATWRHNGSMICLAVVLMATANSRAADEPAIELLPPLEAPLSSPVTGPDDPLPPMALEPDSGLLPQTPADGLIVPLTPSPPGEVVDEDGPIVALDEAADADFAALMRPPTLGNAFGYDTATGGFSWIAEHDGGLGWVSLESFATLPSVIPRGLVTGFGAHFLDGPIVTDMPSRLFDFSIGYQVRQWVAPNVGLDVVARVGAFSDFETSARDGVRFPSHAVTFFRLTPAYELLLGVDVLDRDDISLLPVFGAVWMPSPSLQLDLAFPRPQASLRLGASNAWAYVRGQLGGGTWAIERAAGPADNATYRDVRLLLGVENRDNGSARSNIELGFLFARELSYRSGIGNIDLDDAVMISLNNAF